MDLATQILIIILASTLTVFLLLSIVALVLVIKVVKVVKRVMDKADDLADKAEAIGDIMQHASAPIVAGRIITLVSDKFFKRPKK